MGAGNGRGGARWVVRVGIDRPDERGIGSVDRETGLDNHFGIGARLEHCSAGVAASDSRRSDSFKENLVWPLPQRNSARGGSRKSEDVASRDRMPSEKGRTPHGTASGTRSRGSGTWTAGRPIPSI